MHPLFIGVLTVASLILAGGLKTGNDFIDKLKFHINPFQLPSKITFSSVEYPISIRIDNPSNIGVKIDSLFVSLYRKKNGIWENIANSKPNPASVNINPISSTDFNIVLHAGLLSAATTLMDIKNNLRANEMKIETTIGVHGKQITIEKLMTV